MIRCNRNRTYGVTLGAAAEDYRVALLRHRLVERWFAEGANESEIIADAEVGRE